MDSSSQPLHDLNRSLRAVLAHGRSGTVNPLLWGELKERTLSCLDCGSAPSLQSALSTLKKERHCVSQDDWKSLQAVVLREVVRRGRTELLSIFQNLFSDCNLHQGNKRSVRASSDFSGSRKKPRSGHVIEEKPKEDGKEVVHMDTFYLLKSDHIPNQEHAVALDEIVTAGADFTVVCNYKVDVPWMWERAPALQTSRKVLIVHGETDADERDWISFLASQGASERVRFARPRTPPYGTVHSKMFILFFPTGCRICVHTANMVACDWDYKTQGAYLRDFPLRDPDEIPSQSYENQSICRDFEEQLERYLLHALSGQLRDDVLRLLARYDFSSAGVALISSVPGIHRGPSKSHFGHTRLREVLHQERMPCNSDQSVAVCQFSSLGSIQKKWLEEEFKETLFTSAERSSAPEGTNHREEIKLVFPTLNQVQQSNEGLQAGASLPVTGKNLRRDHIVSKLHKWDAHTSGREKAMPHIKTFLRYGSSRPHSPFWLLLGSFNLSVAAWGRMQGKKKGQEWDRLNLLSYEIGVLFSARLACPVKHFIDASVKFSILSSSEKKLWDVAREEGKITLETSQFMSTTLDEGAPPERDRDAETQFVLTLPLPYALPPPKYSSSDTPWTTEFCAIT